MAGSVRRIAYISRATGAAPLSDARIASFQRNNQRDGLTGALLLMEDRFLLYLEGPPVQLADCLARIERDPDHTDFVLLLDAAGTERHFADWGLRVLRPAPDALAQLQKALAALADPNQADAGVRAFELLWSLAHEGGAPPRLAG
jgi:hypothetical protein